MGLAKAGVSAPCGSPRRHPPQAPRTRPPGRLAPLSGPNAPRWHTLAGVRSPALIRELTKAEFLAELDLLVAIYAAAMSPDPADVPGRRQIMQRHAGNRGFSAITVSADQGS